MQDRYAGDVGDFGKLGMLRQISHVGLKVGINWYLTYKPEEHSNNDGKHTGYINDRSFKNCDDALLESLQIIIRENRSIAALEKANLIPDASYYSEILRPGNDHSFQRDVWHGNSMKALFESDIIFCDPDNGLIVKSVSPYSTKSDKYVTPNELTSYYLAGKSVIFYNHRCREKEHVYLQRFEDLKQSNALLHAQWRGLKFARGTIRDYLFILHPNHVDKVTVAIDNLMRTNWSKHFSIVNL